VGPGELVGICLNRSSRMLEAMLGVLKAGGAYVPLDPDYPSERLTYMMEHSGARVLVTEKACEIPAGARATRVYMDADDWRRASVTDKVAGPAPGPDDLAYVIYTSGSTGKPKGVAVHHRAVVNFLTSMAREPGLTASDVVLAVTTLSFDIAVLELLLPLIVGAKVVVVPRDEGLDGARLLARLRQCGATVMQATPAGWRVLLAGGWAPEDRIKVLCGGEPMPGDLLPELLARSDSVWNMYGPTETTVWSTCCRLAEPMSRIPIGRPIANTRMYVLDPQMQPVPVGVRGDIYIGGDGVTKGYLHRPDLTATAFIPEPFREGEGSLMYRTGDVGRFLPDGTLECFGRADNQVKLRGFRVELGEIETVLCDYPSVDVVAATVREDRPGDQRLVAYYVPAAEAEPSVEALRNHLRAALPEYMIPQHFVALNALPTTPSGKIDRKALPAPVVEDHEEIVDPRTDTEAALAVIWRSILQLERIGVHSSFFDLGGHSILGLDLMAAINEHLDLNLPLQVLFESPTIADMAVVVEDVLLSEIAGMTDEEARDLVTAKGAP
jgi:amino acid adenylation domain-containing protein